MEECKEPDILIATTTVGSLADAQLLARAAIEARLAACVQVDAGMTSFYRWEGQLCEEPEVRVTFKTTPTAEPALRELLARRHPYQLPQYLCWKAEASPGYGGWVGGEVGAH